MGALDVVRRCGARETQIRYQDDEEPMVWMAVAGFHRGPDGIPTEGEPNSWVVGAALDPMAAVFDLCDELVDGGKCVHCGRPTGFHPSFEEMLLDNPFCWWQWDPELSTFRQGCGGGKSDAS